MPRLIPEILRIEQNQLASDHPFAFLAELNYEDGILRATNEPQGITFQGVDFPGDVPMAIQRFSEPGLSDTPRLTLLVGNAAQIISALAEQYWMTKLNPVWTVTLWYVDATNPDALPVDANVGQYEVLSIDIDEINAQFTLYDSSISTTRSRPSFTVTPPLFPFARTRT